MFESLYCFLFISVAAAENTPVQACSADLVNVAQTLHFLDRGRFYKELHRVLKPGGVVSISACLLPNLKHSSPEVGPQLQEELEKVYQC